MIKHWVVPEKSVVVVEIHLVLEKEYSVLHTDYILTLPFEIPSYDLDLT